MIVKSIQHYLFAAAAATVLSSAVSQAQMPSRLFVVTPEDSTITLVNFPSLEKVRTLNVGLLPYYVAVSGNGQVTAVTVEGEEKVKFYDTETLEYQTEIPVGKMYAEHMMTLPDGKHAILANRFENQLVVIDLENMKLAYTIDDVDAPHNIQIGSSGRYLYASNKENPGITVVDLKERRVRDHFKVKAIPRGLMVSPDESTIYFGANWIYGFFAMDAKTGKIKNAVYLPPPPDVVPLAENTYHAFEVINDSTLLAVCEGGSYMDVIDIPTMKLVNRFHSVSHPSAVVKIPGTVNKFVIANKGDNSITIAEIDGFRQVSVINREQIGRKENGVLAKRFTFVK